MFYLHTSNRTENLLSHLSHIIELNERRNIFEKELILIQSQGMERIISQTMADYFGSWCNFEYHLPLDFLHLISQKIDLEFTADGLTVSLLFGVSNIFCAMWMMTFFYLLNSI